jgi:hypothetical protein
MFLRLIPNRADGQKSIHSEQELIQKMVGAYAPTIAIEAILETARQQKDQDNHYHESQAAAWVIAP